MRKKSWRSLRCHLHSLAGCERCSSEDGCICVNTSDMLIHLRRRRRTVFVTATRGGKKKEKERRKQTGSQSHPPQLRVQAASNATETSNKTWSYSLMQRRWRRSGSHIVPYGGMVVVSDATSAGLILSQVNSALCVGTSTIATHATKG